MIEERDDLPTQNDRQDGRASKIGFALSCGVKIASALYQPVLGKTLALAPN